MNQIGILDSEGHTLYENGSADLWTQLIMLILSYANRCHIFRALVLKLAQLICGVKGNIKLVYKISCFGNFPDFMGNSRFPHIFLLYGVRVKMCR